MPRFNGRPAASAGAALAVAVLLTLAGCGGDSGPTIAPTPAPTAPPPRVVLSSTYAVEQDYIYYHDFTVTSATPGTLEITVDYTYSDSMILIWLAKGACSIEQLAAEQCQIVASSFTGQKPRRLAAVNQTAGDYVLWIGNAGPHDEGVSYQGVFTPNATGAAPSPVVFAGRRLGQRMPSLRPR